MTTIFRLCFLASIAAFICVGCCTKKDCANAFVVNEIAFLNSPFSLSDTIILSSFVKDGEFTDQVQTSTTSVREDARGNHYLWVDIDFDSNWDYEILRPSDSLRYRIADIKMKRSVCNTCVLGSDYTTDLFSYTVNDRIIFSSYFEVP